MTTNCLHPIGWGINLTSGDRFPIPDKSWNCPVCRVVNKNKLMDRVALYFTQETSMFFVCFTERLDSGRDLKKDLVEFRRVLYRGLKVRDPNNRMKWIYKWLPRPKCKAFWVFEFQKNGMLHVHGIIILEGGMSKEELVQRWTHATRGYSWQADISEAGSIRSAAGYMMKYMSKQFDSDDDYIKQGEHQFKKHERRYSFWKPEGVKTVPWQVWGNAPKVKPGEIEVELGGFWNTDSKYWLNWYNDMQERIGPAFIDYMNYALCGFITRFKIDEYLDRLIIKPGNNRYLSGGGGKRMHSTGEYKLVDEVIMDLIK